MIQISKLSKAYGTQVLFDEITFNINSGERVGLVGRNGHGKSTLLKILLGIEEYDSGDISFPKDYKIGYLSQKIDFSSKTILEEAESALPLKLDGYKETYLAESVLNGLGFSNEDFSKDPMLLSGGFQVRLNLVKILISNADLLLLDEPTNYLDIISLRWLIKFLRFWQGELVLITHDSSFMDQVTTHTVGIHRGGIKKIEGSTKKLYTLISESEEIQEKTRLNQLKKREETEQFIRRFKAKASKAKQVQSRIKSLEREGTIEELREIKTLNFKFNSAPFSAKEILNIKSGEFSYPNSETKLIENLGFTVGKNEKIGIIGKNGKGKTTLLKLLVGELKLNAGSIEMNQHVKFNYYGQTNIDRLDADKTIEQEILAVHPEHNRTAARTICGIMMFEGDLALKQIAVLSGGEKSRVLLGKVIAKPSNLLILDEPTNHLDIQSNKAFRTALKNFEGGIIFVTHDETLLHEIANKLIVFDRGKTTLFDGTYAEFLKKVGWETEDELEEKKEKKTIKLSKKEIRQKKAKITQMRSEAVIPLEKEISELETTLADQKATLIEGTKTGYNDEMAKLSRQIRVDEAKIDKLYEDLESALSEIEELEKKLQIT